MSPEIIGFDYSELQDECAVQVRATAERIHLRTNVALIENGKDLLAIRNMPEMKGRFVAWIPKRGQPLDKPLPEWFCKAV